MERVKVRVSDESYAMILASARGQFDDSGVQYQGDGVEIALKQHTLDRLRAVSPDLDVALMTVMRPAPILLH